MYTPFFQHRQSRRRNEEEIPRLPPQVEEEAQNFKKSFPNLPYHRSAEEDSPASSITKVEEGVQNFKKRFPRLPYHKRAEEDSPASPSTKAEKETQNFKKRFPKLPYHRRAEEESPASPTTKVEKSEEDCTVTQMAKVETALSKKSLLVSWCFEPSQPLGVSKKRFFYKVKEMKTMSWLFPGCPYRQSQSSEEYSPASPIA